MTKFIHQDSFKLIIMKKILSILIIVLTSSLAYAQDKNTNLADQKFNELAYMDAIKIYEKLVQKGDGNPEIYLRLANSHYFNANYVEANKWYQKLFENSVDNEAETYYRYSQTLKSVGDVEKSNSMLKMFSQLNKNDKRSLFYKENLDYLNDIEKISNRYTIENASINTEFIDYGGAFFNQNLVYTSTKPDGTLKNNNKWTNQPYSNLYKSALIDGKLTDSENFDNNVKTKFNESNAIFTKDGLTMYFTKNNYNDGKKGKNDTGVMLIKIYKATLVKNQWTNITELNFNSNDYNCAHPTLSADEKILYFTSDMPDGYGLSDIYKIDINADGTFKNPVNLGDKINTTGKETFPFITNNNELYFSSDGHLGLGGLDIFATKFSENGQISKILNVGKPINSAFDDFGYVKQSFSKMGVFSSNRPGGKGFDDIYTFIEELELPLDYKQTIAGNVKDNVDTSVLKNATVILFDENMKQIATLTTDDTGSFKFAALDCNSNYFLRATANDYQTNEISVKTPNIHGKTQVDILLSKRFIEIKENVDLAKEFDIANINFGFNDWHITQYSEPEMVVLLSILEKYQNMKIKIGSHTDSRGSDKFNLILSNKRANETKKWLVNKGISSNRITTKGYGETKIINQCTEVVECTDKEHVLNRRSEFVIIK